MSVNPGSERVVITGMGVVSPLGNAVETFWRRLVAGQSGVRTITEFDVSERRIQIGAPAEAFEPERAFTHRETQRMNHSTQMAVRAAEEALAQARLVDADERHEAGVLLGCAMGGISASEPFFHEYYETGSMSPISVPKSMTNAAASAVSIRHGLQGQMLTVDAACASSAHAIGLAWLLIRSGTQRIVVTGGSDATINHATLEAWAALRVLSECNDEPENACKPFSLNRDGFALGEGAGVLVLESERSARARGVPIVAEVLGYGFSSDAHHLTAPSGEGQVAAMRRALETAGLEASAVDHVNAHGTGTYLNDKTETEAIKQVLDDHASAVPVVSIKGAIGHLMGASGAVEGIASVLALVHDCVPPTRNYQEPDPECDLDYVGGEARRHPVRTVLSNSFAFGGSNASVVFRKAS